jgi:hypothetical protein
MHGAVLKKGWRMAEEFSTEVVKRFTGEIASRLGKASALATTAQALNSQGLTEHAFDTLMDVETLIIVERGVNHQQERTGRRSMGLTKPRSSN